MPALRPILGKVGPHAKAWGPHLPALAIATGGVIGAQLALPEPAAAGIDLTPWDGLSPFNDILEGLGGAAGDIVEKGFQYIVNVLFGGKPAELTTGLLSWLVDIPDFSGGAVGRFEKTTAVIAGALLSAVLTLSVIRFWVAGIGSGGGGMEALQGVARSVGAVVMIVTWPTVFGLVGDATGGIADALLTSRGTTENVGEVLASGVGIGALTAATGLPLFMGIIVAIGGMLLLLGLVMMKILVTAMTVILFVGLPLALVLWPIPETSWVAGILAKAFAVVTAIPVIWAVVFGSFAALWSDTLLVDNNGKGEKLGIAGSLADAALIKPLVALALLYLAIVVPKRLIAMAPMVGGGGGGGTMRYLGTSYAAQAVMPHMPGIGGGGGAAGGAGRVIGGSLSGGAAGQAIAGAGGAAAGGAAASAAGGAAAGQQAAGSAAAAAGSSAAAAGMSAAGAAGSAGTASTGGAPPAGAGGSAARTAEGSPARNDRWGGPSQPLDEARAEAISGRAMAMREMPNSERPSASQMAAADASLPEGLQRATRNLMDTAEPPQIRNSLASYAEHPAGRAHADALQTIGTANRPTWAGHYGANAGRGHAAASASTSGGAAGGSASGSSNGGGEQGSGTPASQPPALRGAEASAVERTSHTTEVPRAASLGLSAPPPVGAAPPPPSGSPPAGPAGSKGHSGRPAHSEAPAAANGGPRSARPADPAPAARKPGSKKAPAGAQRPPRRQS